MLRYILESPDRLYFTHPHGDTGSEWTDNARDAFHWADFDSCAASAAVWQKQHGIELRVLQLSIGEHFYSVTLPGTPVLTVSHVG
jgi:hypothetical protein